MLIPDAWSKKSKTLPRNHQQLFNFLNSTIEPWDGPAAIAATDNDWAIVANDRNGLRPLRYIVTKDKLLFAGSETGMVSLEENKIVSKGRLGPGQIIGIKLDKGKDRKSTRLNSSHALISYAVFCLKKKKKKKPTNKTTQKKKKTQ